MNRTLGFELLAYSISMLALAALDHLLAGGIGRTTIIVGVASGAVCIFFALAAVTGRKGKALPLLALTAASFLLLSEAMHLLWPGATTEDPQRRSAGVLAAVMLVLSIAMLMTIAWTGAFGAPGQGSAAAGKPRDQNSH